MREPKAGVGSNQYATRPGDQPMVNPSHRLAVMQGVHGYSEPDFDDETVGATESDRALLERMASGPVEDRLAAAGNKDTPPVVLASLADDVDSNVSSRAALNPSTPPDVLTRLAAGEWKTTRFVIQNPSCPASVLREQWEKRGSRPPHAQPDLIAKLCDNQNTPHDVLIAAAEQTEEARRVLPGKPWVPTEALRVCQRHAKTPNQLAAVIANPQFPPDEMASAVGRKKAEVLWRAIAHNPSSPPDLLSTAARHKETIVRKIAAANPSLPESDLENLLFDSDPQVRSIAQSRELPEHLAVAVAFMDGL